MSGNHRHEHSGAGNFKVNEIYFPHVDSPNTRDLQFLITDGETFFHEERRDLDHHIDYPEENSLFYRLADIKEIKLCKSYSHQNNKRFRRSSSLGAAD